MGHLKNSLGNSFEPPIFYAHTAVFVVFVVVGVKKGKEGRKKGRERGKRASLGSRVRPRPSCTCERACVRGRGGKREGRASFTPSSTLAL